MSFPRYPEYKDSGVAWLGEVPAHWTFTRVKYLLRNGYEGMKIGPFGSQLTSEMFEDAGEFKVYGQENVIAGDYQKGGRYIGEDKFRELSVYEITPGDLLVTMMGTSGKCGVAPLDLMPGVMDSHLLRLRVNKFARPEFIRLLIDESAYVSHQVRMSGKGSIMHGLNSSIVGNLLIALPAVEEQDALLTFLDRETAKIDALVAEQEKLIALLKEKRQAVISHAVTKGLDPTVPMKDSGIEWLGEVPAHWGVGKIRWSFTTTSGSTPNTDRQDLYYGGEIPWIRSLDLTNGVVDSWEIGITEEAIRDTACKRLPVGSILVAMYGGDGTIGKNGLLAIEAATNQAICALLPSGNFYSQFVLAFMQYQRPFWMVGAEGTRKDPNISQDRVRDAKIPHPPLDEQKAIADHIGHETSKIDALIQEAESAILLLQERRNALISAAVTGKIDVRGRTEKTKEAA